ncbi:hypothetical protein GH714_031071 [Hevea brasiliensis]|uniref:Uncharacterized protein n=1 Tax=Hevea brasiliensis TaxID=3981 RepID=A0A6A6LFJ0_HEVBR|nr:hypothetical protein GH714_031071 [Hevea brasiliensis]
MKSREISDTEEHREERSWKVTKEAGREYIGVAWKRGRDNDGPNVKVRGGSREEGKEEVKEKIKKGDDCVVNL